MSQTPQLSDKKKILLIFSISIAVGFACGWWLITGDFRALDRADPSSQFSTHFKTVKNVPKGLFYYGGSTVWGKLRQNLELALQSAYPQFQLHYKLPPGGDPPSSGRGIAMLLENQLDFAHSSRPLTKEEHQEAQQRGFKIEEIPVAIDGVAIAVNRNLPISNLTVRQFCQIYDGSITNWREVGGPDLPINTYLKIDQDNSFCHRTANNSPQIEEVPETTSALRKVQANLGGIYWSSASLLVSQCGIKTLAIERIYPYLDTTEPQPNCSSERKKPNIEAFQNNSYPLTRRLFVLVKKNGLDAQRAGEAYAELMLTDEGQQMIRELGFVNLK